LIKKLGGIFIVLLAVLGAELKSTLGLESILIGADAMGRGGTYLTNEDSNHPVFQNYSFLSEKFTPRISMTVFKLMNELSYLSAAYSMDNFSIGFLNMQDNGGYVRDGGGNIIGGKIGYSDTTLYGAMARRFDDKYNLGARVKFLQKSLSQVDTTAWGAALDLAGSYDFNEYWTFGAELNNMMSTPLHWSNGDYLEQIPLSFALGGKFKAFGPDGFWRDWFNQQVDFYGDLRLEEQGSFFNVGAEYWLSQYVALRAGINQTYTVNDKNEASKYTKFVAGVGFNWNNFYFDYAYNPGDDIAENITHFFTIAYRFGNKEKPVPTKDPVIIIEPTPIRKRLFVDTQHLTKEEQVMLEDMGFLGFMIGYGDGLFEPEQPLTRRELMLMVTRLLAAEGRDPQVVMNKYFPDIAETQLNDIRKVIRNGILRGYPDGLARVQRPVRRDEAAAVFARYAEISAERLAPAFDVYADVSSDHWAYKDVNLTKQHLLTEGIGKNLYRPRDYMLRLDAARVLSRMEFVQSLRLELPPIEGLTYEGNFDNVIYVTPSYNYAPLIFPVDEQRKPVRRSPEPTAAYDYEYLMPKRPQTQPELKIELEEVMTEEYRSAEELIDLERTELEAEIKKLMEDLDK